MKIKHTRDTLSDVYVQSLKIRNTVFVKEQQVPLSLEIDKDEAYAVHFVLLLDDQEETPVSTLRILPSANGEQALIQRVATLKPYRGQGYARKLMIQVLDFLQAQHFKIVELHAQIQAIPFYEKLGFEPFGDIFLDADIQHIAMKKTV